MDIAALSTTLATMDIQTKVSVAILDQTMETKEALGNGLVQMIDAAAMERSVHPELGGNVDIFV